MIKKMEFLPEYCTNIDLIDTSHKKLINLINIIVQKINAEEFEFIFDTLDYLESYVNLHFYEEEQLAVEYKYPNIESLKVSHEMIRNLYKLIRGSIIFYKADSQSWVREFTVNILEYTINLFQTHFMNVDLPLIYYIKEMKEIKTDKEN
jgi:hemerythrin